MPTKTQIKPSRREMFNIRIKPDQRRRRSTTSITAAPMYPTVLTHVPMDTKARSHPERARRPGRSLQRTLTDERGL